MSQRRASNGKRCEVCRVNEGFCVCKHIKPFKIETNVSLVVHVRELKLTSNTAQFAQKMLPDNADIFIRGKVHEEFTAAPILQRAGRPLFLYPHDDAQELNEDFKSKFPGPYHLIIPDGNWSQARKVRSREDGFKDLMAVKLPQGITSEYGLRKALHPEWVSTYEAMTWALHALEGGDIKERLMTFFRAWVNQTQKLRRGEFDLPS
ncbi:MAG TPA: tRNA-uridine aminocarboxypropyltransferase [Bacteriovoracaceae bacterium]|nr:tRNA-uridine aminocarboxypropyltransferase [Bacteriovoracaceae bacterium]